MLLYFYNTDDKLTLLNLVFLINFFIILSFNISLISK